MASKRKKQGTFTLITNYTLNKNEFGWWKCQVNGIHNIRVVYGGNKEHLLSIIKRHVRENVEKVKLEIIKIYKKA